MAAKRVETIAEHQRRLAELKRRGTPPGQIDVADDILADMERMDREERERAALKK